MNFTNALAAWNTPEFENILVECLEDDRHSFRFGDYCTAGGSADDTFHNFVIHSSKEENGSIIVNGSVDFTECVPTGCPDMPMREDRKAWFILTIEKSTGDYEFEPDEDSRYSYGEYY